MNIDKGVRAVFWLPAVILAAFGMPPAQAEAVPSFCSQLELRRPSAEEVGFLRLAWRMSLPDVERMIGATLPQPAVVEKVEDITAPVNVGGVDIRVGASVREAVISDVTLYMKPGPGPALSDCLGVFHGLPNESRVFRGEEGVAAGIRWFTKSVTVTFVEHPNRRQSLGIARSATLEPLTIPVHKLEELPPDGHMTLPGLEGSIVVVQRSSETLDVLKARDDWREEETFLQWLMDDKGAHVDAADLALPALRSERKGYGVYSLVSAQDGCAVSIMMDDSKVTGFYDPCSRNVYDLAGRSNSTTAGLAIPVHHFNEDGDLVVGVPK